MTDILSDVLSAIRFEGSLYFKVCAGAPWVSTNPSMREIGRIVMPSSANVIPFHIMLSGEAWAWPEDQDSEPLAFTSGDILILPAGSRHMIASSRQPRTRPGVEIDPYSEAAKRLTPFNLVEIGEQGTQSTFVCGYLGCDDGPFNPLLGALPPIMIVRPAESRRVLIQSLIEAALDESMSDLDGSVTIMAKLSELMFVEALRRYIHEQPPDAKGWLAGVRDARVGQALRLIHREPQKDWTLADLARQAGTSRSVLAERFLVFTNETPGSYLARWRMQLACRMLESGSASIEQVAMAVGYKSDAAFKRAFKRVMGVPPGKWRTSSATKLRPRSDSH
jgi:AraC-like DNA-binding protein